MNAATGRVYLALVHHPVRGRDGNVITTSVTNLDVHDIARLGRTYGVEAYFLVTPIEAQRALVEHIVGYWREGDGGQRVPERADALATVRAVPSIADALAAVGPDPLIVTTAARSGFPSVSFEACRAAMAAQPGRDVVLMFGTGYGLADEVVAQASLHLAPIRPGGYNHLAVRSAVAIVLDRLFGDAGCGSRS